jgi:hypothetical protein
MLLHLCKSFIYLDLEISLAVTNALLWWQGEFVDGLIIVDILGNQYYSSISVRRNIYHFTLAADQALFKI